MITYQVNEDPQTFFQFIKEHIKKRYLSEIDFLYCNKEIYIRTTNEVILDIIRLKFELIPFEQPDILACSDRTWENFGNTSFWSSSPEMK